jgi:hypothetical protein
VSTGVARALQGVRSTPMSRPSATGPGWLFRARTGREQVQQDAPENAPSNLLDHLVGAREQHRRNVQSDCLGGDPNWWRAVIVSIAVTSALIVVACISGLPSTTCAALAKTYFAAIYNFGFSAMLASSLFLLCMFVSAAADSKTIGSGKTPHTYVAPVIATIIAIGIFAAVITVGIDSLDKSIADCYPGPKGEAATNKGN